MPSATHFPKKRIFLILAALLSAWLIAAAGLTGWLIHSNTVPALTEVTIPTAGLPTAFDGLRILQVSDLHDAEYGKDHAKTLALIREAKPDIILLTGDLVDLQRTNIPLTETFCKEAVKIAPCYYVTGNHEGRLSVETYAELENALTAVGVTVLHGTAVTLEREGQAITLAGVDSPAFAPSPDGAELNALCGDHFTILLAHHPEHAEAYAEAGADLIFSGHVHGGQFRLPLVGGLYGPGQGILPRYDAGLYSIPARDGDTLLYVSRGLGNSRFPIRLANRPEVVLAVLEAK